jgi:hypothetical protein
MTETLGDWEQPGKGPTQQTEAQKRRDALHRDLDRLYGEIGSIETELEGLRGFEPMAGGRRAFLTTGLLLGIVAGATSLLFSIIGSLALGRHPLQLVRTYLSFVLGERALRLETGMPLALGTCLFLLAGAAYGLLFHLVLSRWFLEAPGIWRLLVSSALAIALWLVNYILILRWIQPTLLGTTAVLEQVPFWRAAGTHLVFAWTFLLVENRVRSGIAPDR